MPILLTILGISLLIFIHEFGHFLCARIAGVRVHVFSLGFGPRLWGFRRGDTDYRLSAMPLGGYVQVAGDDPTYDREMLGKADLCSKGFTARAFFYSGGVLMNLLFALVAFPLVFNTGVQFKSPVLGTVAKGGPAWEAGLQRGDRILTADGKEMYSFPNFFVEVALGNARSGVHVTYDRNGTAGECVLYPRYSSREGLRTINVDHAIEKGPYTLDVAEDGPAHAAGLRDGDVLLEFNGRKIFSLTDWRDAHADFTTVREPAGQQEIQLKVRRPLAADGSEDNPGSGEEHAFSFVPETPKKGPSRIGMAPANRLVIGLKQDNADWKELNVRRGDQVRFVDGEPFRGGELEFQTTKPSVSLTVLREGADEVTVLTAKIPPERRAALAASIALGADDKETAIRVLPGSPCQKAGIADGDIVKSVNGKAVSNWDELLEAVRGSNGKPVRLSMITVNGPANYEVTGKRDSIFGFVPQVGPMRYLFQTNSFGGALSAGWVASLDFVKQIYVTLKKLFTGEVSTKNLGGIIMISRVSYSFAQEGLARLFYFLAILSINLAVINVLPIPVLDGGHLMFLLIEKIKGSQVSTKVHNYSQILGLVFVLALMVYVTYNDVLRWIFPN